MASLRSSPDTGRCSSRIDEANLAAARARVKNFLDKPLDFSFDFKVNDLDGKPLSLDQFKGKVVVIDIWGTWCKPCREAIPGLIQLYRRHHRLGLEIVGLAFEQDAPSPEEATEMVKQFVKEMDIPYPCADRRRSDPGADPQLPRLPDHDRPGPGRERSGSSSWRTATGSSARRHHRAGCSPSRRPRPWPRRPTRRHQEGRGQAGCGSECHPPPPR